MRWDKFDELFASFARPVSIYLNGAALAFATAWTAIAHPEALAVTVAASAAVVGVVGYLRSQDKKTAADASSTDKKTAVDAGKE